MSKDVLELETRREIFDLIKSIPGLHMREISRKLDMSIALAEYHLNYLEETEVISAITEGGYKRYYTKDIEGEDTGPDIGYSDRKVLGVLRQKIPLQITLFLLNNKQASLTGLSEELKMSPSKLSFHIKKLLKSGIVRKLKRAEGKGYVMEDERRILRLLIVNKPPKDMLEEFSELWDGLTFY
jgi:predicted transcriptional regulator